MQGFKRHDDQKRPRSVDGFVPTAGRLIPDGKAWEKPLVGPDRIEAAQKDKKDGFTSQNIQLDKQLTALPSLNPYSTNAEKVLPKTHKKNSRFPARKVVFRSFLALFMIGVLLGGYVFGTAWWNARKVLQGGASGAVALSSEVDPTLLNGEGDGRVNILVLGRGGENHPGGDLTDTILIASIDPLGKEAALLSIPRDLWVRVPDFWSMKINAVFTTAKERAMSNNGGDLAAAEKAGVASLENILETNVGLPIHYYVLVNFTAFQQGVDAVGGVEVNVKEPLYDYLQAWDNGGNPLLAAEGIQQFDGHKALMYVRSRSSSSDFARGERQREVAVALKDKVLKLGTFSNPLTVTKLLDAAGDNVSTSLSLNEIMRLYEISKGITSDKIKSLGLTDEPNVLVRTDMIGDQSVVVPRAGTEDFTEIQSFVRTSIRDGYLNSENANVAILNGSGEVGAATEMAEELKSFGYNVVYIGDAPKSDYTSTVLVDYSGGKKKYTKRYLEQRLGVSAVTSSSGINPLNYNADLVVIVAK